MLPRLLPLRRLAVVPSSSHPRCLALPRRRSLGSGPGSHGHSHNSGGGEYGGFNAPHVADIHKQVGDGMMTVMFLWIFYRFKEDGLALLGLEHPWDAHHGHEHHDHIEWTKDPNDPLAQPVPLKESGGH